VLAESSKATMKTESAALRTTGVKLEEKNVLGYRIVAISFEVTRVSESGREFNADH
jgi:hypothetical protein